MWSLDQVDAEVAAWPLWADVGFRPCLTALGCTPKLTYDKATATCYAELEKYLRPRAGGTSLETIRQVCDSRWRTEGPTQPLPLHRYVRRLAEEYLEPDPSTPTSIRLRKNAENTLSWRWLTLTVPPDLLVAAMNGRTEHVKHNLPPKIGALLDQGVAEIHVHLGACMSFSTLWTNAMTLAGAPFLDEKRLERGGPPPFGNGKSFREWLLGAALVRTTLAAFLYWNDRRRIANLAEYVALAWPSVYEQRQHRELLRDFGNGTLSWPAARIATLYRRLGGVTGMELPVASLADLHKRDPASRWLASGTDATGEVELLRLALRYLEARCDSDFARLFWQYVRVRGQTYRHLVQEPGTSGLDWFARHFQRISALRQGLSQQARMDSAWSLENRGLHLESLEVREAPESKWQDIRDIVQAAPKLMHSLVPSSRRPIGIVFHFKKEWHGSRNRAHADPGRTAVSSRYGRYALERTREARAIATAMARCPHLLIWLRGLDICSEELSIPNWVILPILAELRAVSKTLAVDARKVGFPCEPLRLTLHCGEDYRSLHEGLRRLHEPLSLSVLESGDRIGHALALGHDVSRLMADQSSVIERDEDRLENLLWEWDLYETRVLPKPSARSDYLRTEIEMLGLRIFGETTSVDLLTEVRRLRNDGAVLRRWGYPRLYTATPKSPAEQILFDYLTDCNVYIRGQRTQKFTLAQQDAVFLREAQNMIVSEFARLRITIEANPSSNLLIGNFGSLMGHPMFRLKPPLSVSGGMIASVLARLDAACRRILLGILPSIRRDISVAIADDDPITFATSLHEEYVYTYWALRRHDMTETQSMNWLDTARRAGIKATFALDASKDTYHLSGIRYGY